MEPPLPNPPKKMSPKPPTTAPPSLKRPPGNLPPVPPSNLPPIPPAGPTSVPLTAGVPLPPPIAQVPSNLNLPPLPGNIPPPLATIPPPIAMTSPPPPLASPPPPLTTPPPLMSPPPPMTIPPPITSNATPSSPSYPRMSVANPLPPTPANKPLPPMKSSNGMVNIPPPVYNNPPPSVPAKPVASAINRPLSPPPPLPTHNSSGNLPTHSSSGAIPTTGNYRNSTDSLTPIAASQSIDQPEIYPQTRIAEENFNYLKDIYNKVNKRVQASQACTREGNSLAESFKNYGTMLISQSDTTLGQCLFKIGGFQKDYENFRDVLDAQSLSGLKGTVDQFINRDMKVVRASRKNFDKIKTMYDQIDAKVTANVSKGKGINLVKQAELQQERDYMRSRVTQVGQESLSTIKLANESNSVEIMEQIVEYMENLQLTIKNLSDQVNSLKPAIEIYKKEATKRRAELEKSIEQSQRPATNVSGGIPPPKESKSIDDLDRLVPGEEPKKARLRRFISGERFYVSSLSTLVSVFLNGLRTDDRLFSKVFKEDEVAIFSNIELIYSNQTKFLEELENTFKMWGEQNTPSIGAVFFRNSPKLMQLYSTYINNFSNALVTISRIKQSKNFQAFLKTCEEKSDGADLDSLIPLPLTRITNYLIFLQDYKETLSQSPQDQTELKHVLGAKDKIQSISELVEQSHNLIQLSRLQQSLTGFDQSLVEEGRFLIKEAMMTMSLHNSNITNSSGQSSNSQATSYYFILLTDILMYCKKEKVLFPVSLSDWAVDKRDMVKYKYLGKFELKNMDTKNSLEAEDGRSSFQMTVGSGVTATVYFETKSLKEEWLQTINKAISKSNQNKVFGIPLETLYHRPTELGRAIPSFVQRICDFIYDNCAQEEGIFRLSANQKSLDSAKEEIETGVELDYGEMDTHAVAGLLKLWVRNLPEPLLTFKAYDAFMAVADLDTKPQRFAAIKANVEKLPLENKFCIYYLMRVLTKVSEFSSVNKMTPNNISIVFATLLLKKKDANPMDCTNFNTIFGVIEGFMTGYKEIFSEVEKQYNDYLYEQANSSKRKSVMPNKPLPMRPSELPPTPKQLPQPGSQSSSPSSSSSEIEWTKQSFDDASDSDDEGFSVGKSSSITIQLGEIVKQGYLTKKGAMRRNWTKRWFVLKQGYLFYFKTSKDKKPKGIIQLVNVSITKSYYKPNCMAIRSTVDKEEREFLIVATSQSDLEDWITNISKCISK